MATDDDSVHNPHDRFTRRILSDLENVRELVAWRMPAEVLAVLNLDSIRPINQSFVNKLLREGMSDLVFEIELAHGSQAYVVFLFEHKSAPDATTPFQVLRYMVHINEQRLRTGEPLCCVIPLVLYHGRERWNTARTTRELIDAPDALKAYIPTFVLPLLDLSVCSDQELRQESLFLAYMSLLKYIQRDELPERLPEILGLIRRLLPPATALESLETVLRYLVSGTDRVTRDELTSVVTNVLESEGTIIMPTIAEQWKQEGFEKGRSEGRSEGREEGIEKGKLIGRVRTLEEFLSRSPTSEESLSNLSIEQLQQLAKALESELNERS